MPAVWLPVWLGHPPYQSFRLGYQTSGPRGPLFLFTDVPVNLQ